jgi:hypothetical protein
MISLRQTWKNNTGCDLSTVNAREVVGTIRSLADSMSPYVFFSLHINRMLCIALSGSCVEVQRKAQWAVSRSPIQMNLSPQKAIFQVMVDSQRQLDRINVQQRQEATAAKAHHDLSFLLNANA